MDVTKLPDSFLAVTLRPDEDRDEVTRENPVSVEADMEQTWPDKEDMEHVRTKRVPRGTSQYQAAWIDDEEEGESGEEFEEIGGVGRSRWGAVVLCTAFSVVLCTAFSVVLRTALVRDVRGAAYN